VTESFSVFWYLTHCVAVLESGLPYLPFLSINNFNKSVEMRENVRKKAITVESVQALGLPPAALRQASA
jgi:hypothetical protein